MPNNSFHTICEYNANSGFLNTCEYTVISIETHFVYLVAVVAVVEV